MSTLDKILELIANNKITHQQFLKDIGLNPSTISDWKRGASESYKKHIDKIADYFNVSVDYLLGRDNMEFTETEQQKQLNQLVECFNELSSDDKTKVVEYAQMLRERSKK